MGEETGAGGGERIYTIPLRDVKKAPRWKRSNRAIAIITEYLVQHTKFEDVVLDSAINEKTETAFQDKSEGNGRRGCNQG
jgi:ribosomal protein L31E